MTCSFVVGVCAQASARIDYLAGTSLCNIVPVVSSFGRLMMIQRHSRFEHDHFELLHHEENQRRFLAARFLSHASVQLKGWWRAEALSFRCWKYCARPLFYQRRGPTDATARPDR